MLIIIVALWFNYKINQIKKLYNKVKRDLNFKIKFKIYNLSYH